MFSTGGANVSAASHGFRRLLSRDAKRVSKQAQYDAIIVGGGHNGLVAASYLAKKGLKILVLERREVVGGAAITEEIIPGFKFSRASYLAGLLRPVIMNDLNLKSHGLEFLVRDPSSFTPCHPSYKFESKTSHKGAYMMLGSDNQMTFDEISKFSKKDAEAYFQYESHLDKLVQYADKLIDSELPQPDMNFVSLKDVSHKIKFLTETAKLGRNVVSFYEMMTAPAAQILDRWFESDILKATLATDSVIGAMTSPYNTGSAYVLFHHVMGNIEGRRGVWAYVKGGMGAISGAIASAAKGYGAELRTNSPVKQIIVENNEARGVLLENGQEITSKIVLANTDPYTTFKKLIDPSASPESFIKHIDTMDFSCGAFKINCAVDRLPNFLCKPNTSESEPGPQHRGTVHFEMKMQDIDAAYMDARSGIPSRRPVIEMTIPSSLDSTLAPPGKHVVQLFVMYAPYDLKDGSWDDPGRREAFADRVFSVIDEYAPGFSSSVIGRDILSPKDLERIFGLHRGNIFHGAMSLHQLAWLRPVMGFSYDTPIDNLFLCGSGTHPGGGVMGAPGRNCANFVLSKVYS